MKTEAVLILVHQLIFQGMFFAKNFLLRRRLGGPVRGRNPEATLAITFFAGFIALSLWLAVTSANWGRFPLLSDRTALAFSLVLLGANMLVAAASLKHLGDSWRVGVIEEQQTALVESATGTYYRTLARS